MIIRGKVTDGVSGAAVPGATVAIRVQDAAIGTAVSDAGGVYLFDWGITEAEYDESYANGYITLTTTHDSYMDSEVSDMLVSYGLAEINVVLSPDRISIPAQFSSVKGDVLFRVIGSDTESQRVSIGSYAKDVVGRDALVNVSDYFRDCIRAYPIQPDYAVQVSDGVVCGRMTSAQVSIENKASKSAYLIGAYDKVMEDKFLTRQKIIRYFPGQVVELSALRNGGSELTIALSETIAPNMPSSVDNTIEATAVKYRIFSVCTTETTPRYVILTDSSGEVLDHRELVRCTYPGVRVYWVNRQGAIDAYNFQPEVSASLSVDKTTIYAEEGYITTKLTAERTHTLTSGVITRMEADILSEILYSESVWVEVGGTPIRIDIVSDSSLLYSSEELVSLSIEYKPIKRLI